MYLSLDWRIHWFCCAPSFFGFILSQLTIAITQKETTERKNDQDCVKKNERAEADEQGK
jgi:hypothetical protein